MITLHESISKTMRANGWDYAFAAGYVHGKEDSENGRKREIALTEKDDFALGYHKGHSSSCMNMDSAPLDGTYVLIKWRSGETIAQWNGEVWVGNEINPLSGLPFVCINPIGWRKS